MIGSNRLSTRGVSGLTLGVTGALESGSRDLDNAKENHDEFDSMMNQRSIALLGSEPAACSKPLKQHAEYKSNMVLPFAHFFGFAAFFKSLYFCNL